MMLYKYLKRTRLSSLPPPAKDERVRYTPGSSCTTQSDFSVCALVPLDKIGFTELPLDSLSGEVRLVEWFSLENISTILGVCLALEPDLLMEICSSGTLSAISFNCRTLDQLQDQNIE